VSSPRQMEEVFDIYGKMPVEQWFVMLRQYWMDRYIVGYLYQLRKIFERHPRERLQMMGKLDRKWYDSLPNEIKIWRGTYPNGRLGMSWSTRRRIAISYPFARDFTQNQPDEQALLLTAIIKKSCCVALLNTSEIICVPNETDFTEQNISIQDFLTEFAPPAARLQALPVPWVL
jgi:hypothetical protein